MNVPRIHPSLALGALLLFLVPVSIRAQTTEFETGLFFRTHYDLGPEAPRRTARLAPSGGPHFVEYSNLEHFLGRALAHGPSTQDGANTITKMVCDDLLPGVSCADGESDHLLGFSVANFDSGNVTVRVRVRLYEDAAGAPGRLFLAFRSAPVSIAPGVSVFDCRINPYFEKPDSRYWAGLFFDNADGATGATPSQLEHLGQGIFGPATVGSSEDQVFVSASAGAHLEDAPSGVVEQAPLGGSPPANFGWEVITQCGGLPARPVTWGSVKRAYR